MSILISQDLYLTQEASNTIWPLTHARIGYKNLITKDNISGPAGEDNFPIESMALKITTEMYKPSTANAVVNVDLGFAQDVNYFGLVGRNMGIVKLEYSFNNIDFVEVYEKDDGSSVISMGLFTLQTAQYWRFTFTGAGQEIITVFLGVTLDMMRPIYGGHTPLDLSRKTAMRPRLSETAQFMGITIQRQGFGTSYDWTNLTASWVREQFKPFIFAARTQPYFIAWRPETFPDEVGYVWTMSDIAPQNMGTRDLMSVNLPVQGYDAETGQ